MKLGFLKILLACMLSSVGAETRLATAQMAAQKAQLTPSDRDSVSVDLTDAERLFIRFRGYPELTGEYRINSDSTVSIPVFGRVSVAGMSPATLEKSLAAKATEIAGKEGFVTVEVAAYRPVFVSGAVKNPGAIQWDPGLTVLQAVALAGGLFRGIDPVGGATQKSEGDTTQKKGVDELKRTLASLARLQAEQIGSSNILASDRLIALVGKAEAQELIERQRALMLSRRSAMESQLVTLERGRQLANQELENLQAQRQRLAEQLSSRREYRLKLQELLAKGTITSSRAIEEDIRVSDLEERTTGVSVGIARVQSAMATMEKDTTLLKLGRETEIHEEIARLERQAAQVQIEIENFLIPPDQSREENSLESGRTRPYAFNIVRKEIADPIIAAQSTLLRPKDVLVVSQ